MNSGICLDAPARELSLVSDLDYFQRIPFVLIAETREEWDPQNEALIRSQMILRVVAKLLRIPDSPCECFQIFASLYRSAWEEVECFPDLPSLLSS